MANKKPSIEELKAKAEGGDVEAMIKLASIYGSDDNEDYGLGGSDTEESKKWYQRASDFGDAYATYHLSKTCSSKKEEMRLLKKAAVLGHKEAFDKVSFRLSKQGEFDEVIDFFTRVFEYGKASSKQRELSAFEIGSWYEKRGLSEDYDTAIDWYKISADLGNPMAAGRLGVLYENGVFTSTFIGANVKKHNYIIAQNSAEAVKWHLMAAQNGYPKDWVYMSRLYREGRLVSKNYEKAFYWMLKAASSTCEEYIREMSKLFELGRGTEQSDFEAYVWALLAGVAFNPDKLQSLEDKLPKQEVPIAQREAELRKGMYKYIGFSQKLFDYMLAKLKLCDPYVQNDAHPVLPDVEPPRPETDSSEPADDPDPTPDITYSYLSVCKKHFNPELVTLELVVPRKLKKTETLDFTRLKIRYDSKDTDTKNVSVLIPFRVNKAERRLLIILAAQSSITDDEKRAESVRKILEDHKNQSRVSHLNAMFRAIFSGCAKTRDERMINRQSGYIAPKLKIDTTKITNARDYPL